MRFIFEENGKNNDRFIKQALSLGKISAIVNHTLLIRKDGFRVPVADSAAPIKDHDGNIFACVVVFRDVTRERAVDVAKTEFVSLASHQLRTPLTCINWFGEMLLRGDYGELSDEQKTSVQEIYQSNQRMIDLIRALLNVSRLEMGTFRVNPSPTNLIDIAEEVTKELLPELKFHQIKFNKKYSPKLPIIKVDRQLIHIVFQNLLSNAIKYSNKGGEVKLQIRSRGKNILIEVSDNGIGIPESEKDKLFNKLFRGETARKLDPDGTGLGLYIVKAILDHSNAKIWFDSVINQGTTFYVTIPKSGMITKKGPRNLEI